jgi:hypothetical protein
LMRQRQQALAQDESEQPLSKCIKCSQDYLTKNMYDMGTNFYACQNCVGARC